MTYSEIQMCKQLGLSRKLPRLSVTGMSDVADKRKVELEFRPCKRACMFPKGE